MLSEPQALAGGPVQFFIEGNRDRSYLIEISTNLDWTTLGMMQYTKGRIPYVDGTATNGLQRVYRARLSP